MKAGEKFDTGKVRMSLLTNQFRNGLKCVARVLTFGANKYPHPESGDRGWRRVPNALERYVDAFDRHMDYVRGNVEDRQYKRRGLVNEYDDESGLLHIDHAICDLLFIRTLLYGDADVHTADK